MDHKLIIKLCKELGCCDACCLRYVGFKSPAVYEDPLKCLHKFEGQPELAQVSPRGAPPAADAEAASELPPAADGATTEEPQGSDGVLPAPETNGGDSPPSKRVRRELCVSCLGILQEHSWPDNFALVKDMLDKKRYACATIAVALSAPIATLLREKAVTLRLNAACPQYEPKSVTPLKEAWKWSFGARLATHVGKTLDSGAVSPLLVTLNMEYPDDLQELEILKTLSPALFESRSQQRKRFTVEFTRRSAEQALSGVKLAALQRLEGWREGVPGVRTPAKCACVVCTHSPVYLGGRYIKVSRSLPQSPWWVGGQRMMESSVQEIIFQPIARLYHMSETEAEHRLKFLSAGREDVDVRCLGDGRPFAVEISDPPRELTAEELQRACEEISASGKVVVKSMVHVSKEALVQLKKGEESKTKTYEALCVKLGEEPAASGGRRWRDQRSGPSAVPVPVTPEDILNINTYRNAPPDAPHRVVLAQKTPMRVLHRRPLLTRTRHILELSAEPVAEHPCLFVVRVRTEAGTYVKEWVHGELGRTAPALGHAVRAQVDILALDVATVDLAWPDQATL